MNRSRSIRTLIVTATLMIGSSIVFAHNGIEHVMGTVSAVTENSITVETVEHSSVTVMVGASAIYSNKGVKASLKALKIGERVAINAKEDSNKKLHAVSVKWGATSVMEMPADHKM